MGIVRGSRALVALSATKLNIPLGSARLWRAVLGVPPRTRPQCARRDAGRGRRDARAPRTGDCPLCARRRSVLSTQSARATERRIRLAPERDPNLWHRLCRLLRNTRARSVSDFGLTRTILHLYHSIWRHQQAEEASDTLLKAKPPKTKTEYNLLYSRRFCHLAACRTRKGQTSSIFVKTIVVHVMRLSPTGC